MWTEEIGLVYKFILKDNYSGKTENLPKTAEWFQKHKLRPHIGDTVIPLELGPVKKPFLTVHSILYDTQENEVIFILERNVNSNSQH